MANTSDEFNKAAGGKAQPLTEKFNGAAKGERGDGMDSIRNHKVQQSHDMPGPDGSKVRQTAAGEQVAKDKSNYDRNWGEKYAKMDIEKGKDKSLSQEFNKSSGITR